VKNLLIWSAVSVLILSTLANPLEATSNLAFTTTVNHHDSEAGPLSVFVEGFERLEPKETDSLNNFGTVTTVVGQVAVLHTHSEDLQNIAHLSFVSKLERLWPLHAYLDESVPDIGANIVWEKVRDSFGRNVTGQGVIIGFVDTGIDVYHPDFTFPNGTTKIAYVWDQTIQGHPPIGFGYGHECTSNDIQARNCPETDTFGHGTHVAGIAASSGRATGNYTGVAPDASIIFVKSGYAVCQGEGWSFDSPQILDGVNYIVTKAAQLKKRVVINLSLGGNIGGHDGSDPLELALDEFVKAGTSIVVSAGNSAEDDGHTAGRLTSGGNVTFQVGVMQSTTDLAIDVWYSTLDEIDGTLTTPSGDTFSIPVPIGSTAESHGNITTRGTRSNHGRELYFEANSPTPLPLQGWSVTLRAHQINLNGTWDAWVDSSSCSVPGASFLSGNGYSIDTNDTIGIPGTAHYVVTVGAYVTKTSWKGMNGQEYGSRSNVIGEIAAFSSRGPTRDMRVKPDIVAPGTFIASARSNLIASKPSDPDAFHRILAGTSMASPHVAGTIALMLQYSPDLQAIQLPKILSDTARQDAETGLLAVGSPTWGFGKLDARTATGFLRLTLLVQGLPSDEKAPIRVDGSPLNVSSSSWLDLYFPKGTTHTVGVGELLSAKEGTQFRLADARAVLGRNSVTVLNYQVKVSELDVTINQTEIIVLRYEPVPAPNTFVLVLPSIALLILVIVTFSLGYELLHKRKRVAATRS
jgi:subtilisin family serine protease